MTAAGRESCAYCHVVAEGGLGTDAVPSFATIVQEAGDDIMALRGFTLDPHPQMPQFADLSEQQVQNLITYFRTCGINQDKSPCRKRRRWCKMGHV